MGRSIPAFDLEPQLFLSRDLFERSPGDVPRFAGEDAVLSFALDNMKARIYGDAAVVTGRMTAKQMFKGQDISGQYQCTDLLIKNADRWQCVATHLSRIMQGQ